MSEEEKLDRLRAEIDRIDLAMLKLFWERMSVADDIGEYKRAHLLEIEDAAREQSVITRRVDASPERLRPLTDAFMRTVVDCSKRVQMRSLNLYLIGMPDCGKTRFAKKISSETGLMLFDTDKVVMARFGMTIDELFQKTDEDTFRDAETQALLFAARQGSAIVATGGGAILRQRNIEIMRGSGLTVFLDRRLENLLNQKTVNRPLLREGGDAMISCNITRIYNERHDAYAAAADISIDPDAPDAVKAIIEFYTQKTSGMN